VLHVVVEEAELACLVAAEIREEHVDMLDERLEDPARARLSQVELDALLVAVEGLEEERVLGLLKRRDVPAYVAACGRILDLDHLRAEVGQLERGPRPGAVLLEREDADSRERRSGCHFVSSRATAAPAASTSSNTDAGASILSIATISSSRAASVSGAGMSGPALIQPAVRPKNPRA